jgi:hypothetical protein
MIELIPSDLQIRGDSERPCVLLEIYGFDSARMNQLNS